MEEASWGEERCLTRIWPNGFSSFVTKTVLGNCISLEFLCSDSADIFQCDAHVISSDSKSSAKLHGTLSLINIKEIPPSEEQYLSQFLIDFIGAQGKPFSLFDRALVMVLQNTGRTLSISIIHNDSSTDSVIEKEDSFAKYLVAIRMVSFAHTGAHFARAFMIS